MGSARLEDASDARVLTPFESMGAAASIAADEMRAFGERMEEAMDDMENRNPLDPSNVEKGIDAACAAFDGLGLTLPERWMVCRALEISARKMLGPKLDEFAAAGEYEIDVDADEAMGKLKRLLSGPVRRVVPDIPEASAD